MFWGPLKSTGTIYPNLIHLFRLVIPPHEATHFMVKWAPNALCIRMDVLPNREADRKVVYASDDGWMQWEVAASVDETTFIRPRETSAPIHWWYLSTFTLRCGNVEIRNCLCSSYNPPYWFMTKSWHSMETFMPWIWQKEELLTWAVRHNYVTSTQKYSKI